MNIIPGSYVTHTKLPDLGNGEVLSSQDGLVCIRFASGNRTFKHDLVVPHLKVTSEAPLPPAPKSPKRPKKEPRAAQDAKH